MDILRNTETLKEGWDDLKKEYSLKGVLDITEFITTLFTSRFSDGDDITVTKWLSQMQSWKEKLWPADLAGETSRVWTRVSKHERWIQVDSPAYELRQREEIYK